MGIPDILRSSTNKLMDRKCPWIDPHKSLGAQCATISGLKCWEAAGPALELMKEIAPQVKDILDNNAELIEGGEAKPRTIAYRIWMIGSDENSATPHLVLSSRSRRQLKLAKTLLKESKIKREHPELQIRTQGKMPALLRTNTQHLKDSIYNNVEVRLNVVKAPNGPCGMLVRTNENCLATISGAIMLNGSYWGIIPQHSCFKSEDDYSDSDEDHDSCDFDDDSDDEGSDDVEITSRGSISSDGLSPLSGDSESSSHLMKESQNLVELPLFPIDSERREEDGMQGLRDIRQIRASNEDEDKDENEDEFARFLLSPVVRDIDYEIFSLEKGNIRHPNRVLKPGSTMVSEEYVEITDIVLAPKNGPVWALTGTTGCVRGYLLENPCYMKIGGSKTFQEMWQVRLERQTLDGDSGSWVIDAVTGSVYGHIIAGDPTSNLAFVVPIISVFQDIEKRFHSKPRLLTAQDFKHLDHSEKYLSPSEIIEIGAQEETSFILFVHGEVNNLQPKSWRGTSTEIVKSSLDQLYHGFECRLYTTQRLSLPYMDGGTSIVLVGRRRSAKTTGSLAGPAGDCIFWFPMYFITQFMTTLHAPYGEPKKSLEMIRIRPSDAAIFQLFRDGKVRSIIRAFNESWASPYDFSPRGSLLDIAICSGAIDIVQYLLRYDGDVRGEISWLPYGPPSFYEWRALLRDKLLHGTLRDQMTSLLPELPVEPSFSTLTRLLLKLEPGDIGEAIDDSNDNPDTYDETGNTQLYRACFYGDSSAVKKLLETGVNPNALNGAFNATSLMAACEKVSFECAEMLLRAEQPAMDLTVQINGVDADHTLRSDLDVSGNESPHKIHIRGVDDFTISDIKAFSIEHFPNRPPVHIEWIDDTSANLVYSSPRDGFKALDQLSLQILSTIQPTDLRLAKTLSTHPNTTLYIRTAFTSDQKKPRAYEASRFYMMHPEHDPREQRQRNYSQNSNGDYQWRRYSNDENRRRRRRDKEEGFHASIYNDNIRLGKF